jgi:hypothetical protein
VLWPKWLVLCTVTSRSFLRRWHLFLCFYIYTNNEGFHPLRCTCTVTLAHSVHRGASPPRSPNSRFKRRRFGSVLRYHPSIFLETTSNVSQISWSPRQDVNLGPLQYPQQCPPSPPRLVESVLVTQSSVALQHPDVRVGPPVLCPGTPDFEIFAGWLSRRSYLLSSGKASDKTLK